MICPKCNGRGFKLLMNRFCDLYTEICDKCGGSGVEEPMTNEEWLNSLALDTKAYWLSCICGRAVWEAKYDNNAEKGTLDYWKEWLKEKHE